MAMALLRRESGTYQSASQAWIKVNGVYRQVTAAYVKVRDTGPPVTHTWHQCFNYDKTPPDPPEISLQMVQGNNDAGKQKTWIKVGVRLAATGNVDDVRLIRVLTNYPKSSQTAPTGHEGGEYTSDSDSDWPKEPWSEWRYNKWGQHNDTSVFDYKQWPVNGGPNNPAQDDHDYFFKAWAMDGSLNWSGATLAHVHTPKAGVDSANVIIREANFQPNTSGSWRNAGFQWGDLFQNDSPRTVGLFFYGNQLTDSIGSHGDATIRSASIWLKRIEDDAGASAANLYTFWNGYGAPGDLPAAGTGITKNEPTKISPPMIGKGVGAWYDIPDAYFGNLENKQIHAIGLDYKDPQKAGAFDNDYSGIEGVGRNLKNGQLHITWAEKV